MEKMTNVKALEVVLAMELTDEVREKIENIRNSYIKKSATKSDKPTKTQIENADFKQAILGGIDGKMTISEMIKGIDALADLSNQRVSAIVRQMVADGTLVREEIKRKAYFSIA